MPKKKSDLDFGKAFAELETIAAWFEQGEADLTQGLTKFERAMALATELKGHLQAAENKIKEIKMKHE
ncbi:exodeoxyribonuclease VII small subunit [Candidatus Uhrbacteria bacterium]|nr:exodeoxyribonuclease VII small subunit [Candidatus Uhrbacteria bacterium]